MKKDIVIIGAGDFGREVAWLIERINHQQEKWEILGFIDDDENLWGRKVDGYSVLGGSAWLKEYQEEIYCVCSLGVGETRKKILERFIEKKNIKYPSLIDPSVIIGKDCVINEGSIICAGNILAIGTHVGKHVIVNLSSTLGHDDQIGDYCVVNPGCNLSGRVITEECVDIGTGTKIIQGIHIVKNTVIGAGSTVVRDIEQSGTYVGTPAKAIKLRY